MGLDPTKKAWAPEKDKNVKRSSTNNQEKSRGTIKKRVMQWPDRTALFNPSETWQQALKSWQSDKSSCNEAPGKKLGVSSLSWWL